MGKYKKTKNDEAWEKISEKYDLINNVKKHGSYNITSSQINEFREARLMVKFDHEKSMPKIFQDNKISIIPDTRGSYIIGSFKLFHSIEENKEEIKIYKFPAYIESIDYRNMNSETILLNAAYLSGIIDDFVGEDDVLPTVNGRMGSDIFSYYIENIKGNTKFKVNVRNSQIEIDGAYEGFNDLSLFEAKNLLSDDFVIRQLYYPYRTWKKKITKNIRSIFMQYSNGIYYLNEYAFENIEDYNSIVLLKSARYSLEECDINMDMIKNIRNSVNFVDEPRIPFPQADKFERVINLLELLYKKDKLSSEEITKEYMFDSRQTDYYTNAARYIGFAEKSRVNGKTYYKLSLKGKELFNSNIIQRNLLFVNNIIEHKVFALVFDKYFKTFERPSDDVVVDIMKQSNLYNINEESTYYRRTSTVVKWIEWIFSIIKE